MKPYPFTIRVTGATRRELEMDAESSESFNPVWKSDRQALIEDKDQVRMWKNHLDACKYRCQYDNPGIKRQLKRIRRRLEEAENHS